MSESLLFQLRVVSYVAIDLLGFFAPWDRVLPSTTSLSTWLVMAAAIARQGWMSFTGATVGVLVVAIVLTVTAAGLRTWSATARRGEGGAREGEASRVRWWGSRAGIVLYTLAISVLMPPSGAVFAIVATALLEMLRARFAGPVCRETTGVPDSPVQATWGRAFLEEIYFWGVAGNFAGMGWKYNAFLLQRGVLVAFGCALVVRALMPKGDARRLT